MILWVALALIAGVQSDTPHSAGQQLIFELPDGVRSNPARIVGEGRGEQNSPTFREAVALCSGRPIVVNNNVSHRVFVAVDSRPDDEKVVACVKRRATGKFNVGIGQLQADKFPRINNQPFVAFEGDQSTALNKAR